MILYALMRFVNELYVNMAVYNLNHFVIIMYGVNSHYIILRAHVSFH